MFLDGLFSSRWCLFIFVKYSSGFLNEKVILLSVNWNNSKYRDQPPLRATSTATYNNKMNLPEGCDSFLRCRQIFAAHSRYSRPSVCRRDGSDQTVTMRSNCTATTDHYMVQGWQAFAVVGKSEEFEQQQNHKDSGPRKLHLHRRKYSRETKFESGT